VSILKKIFVVIIVLALAYVMSIKPDDKYFTDIGRLIENKANTSAKKP